MDYYELVALADGSAPLLQDVLSLSAEAREQALTAELPAGVKRYAVAGGVGVVPVRGVLLDEWSPFGPRYGATGYNYITAAAREAAADSSIGAVVLDINSGGGLYSGAPEAAASLRTLSKKGGGTKPLIAVIRSTGASAAYMLGAPADLVFAQPSARVGSIGAKIMHISVERALANNGIKVEEITSAALKADVSMFKDLTAETRARLQEGVDDAARQFIEQVAAYRGLKADDVAGLQAAVLPARSWVGRKTALDAGLIDAVVSADEAIAEVMRQHRR